MKARGQHGTWRTRSVLVGIRLFVHLPFPGIPVLDKVDVCHAALVEKLPDVLLLKGVRHVSDERLFQVHEEQRSQRAVGRERTVAPYGGEMG